MSDPRNSGFNYGKGWGALPKPPIYHHAAKLAREIGRDAALKSSQAWALELALWRVRIATTGVEKAVAVAALASEVEKAMPAAE